jgi:hypothetical protein
VFVFPLLKYYQTNMKTKNRKEKDNLEEREKVNNKRE